MKPSARSDTNPRRRRLLILVVLAASSLALRLGLGYAMRDSFFERGNRSSGIFRIADTLLSDGEFAYSKGDPTAVNEPVYPVFVALSFALFGKGWFALALTQSLAGLVNAFLIYLISLKVYADRSAALFAAVFAGFYPFYISQSVSVSDTVLFCLLIAVSGYVTLRAAESGAVRAACLGGACWGLAVLTRQSAAALAAAAIAYVIARVPKRDRWTCAAVVLLTMLITMAPWAYRNYRLTKTVFLSSHGALELWLGHNGRTRDILRSDLSVDALRSRLPDEFPELFAETASLQAPSIEREVKASGVYLERALQRIRERPLEALGLMPLKLAKFWSWKKTPRTNSLEADRSPLSIWWDRLYSVYFPLLFLTSLAGLILTCVRKTSRSSWLLLLMILFFSLFHMAVYGFTRLRTPLDQFLMVFAGYAFALLLRQGSRRTSPAGHIGGSLTNR